MSDDIPTPNSARLRLVYRFLDCDLVDNALFLLDRLHAQDPDNTCWVHLRSPCCLRLVRYAAAYEYSRAEAARGEHTGCVYVFARACLHLNLPRDGILVLERLLHRNVPETSAKRFLPDSAALSCLLGKLHRANDDVRKAVDAYARALQAGPFMWDAFTDLCDTGVTLRLSNIFQPRSPSASPLEASEIISGAAEATPSVQGDEDEEMSNTIDAATTYTRSLPKPQTPAKRRQVAVMDVLSRQAALLSVDQILAEVLATERGNAQPIPYSPHTQRDDLGKVRRQARVILEPTSRQALPADQPGSSQTRPPTTTQDIYTRRRKLAAVSQVTSHPTTPIRSEDLKPLYGLFLTLGSAYYHLARFQPRACLEALSTLPAEQQAASWVLAKTARAHYEMMAYTSAQSAFEALRASCASWVEDLEVHAATLWHLGDDVRLTHQAHDLTEHHRLSPQAWCAAGCAMSRAGRPQEALACFRRAIQLRPPLARAYSLLGHEHFDCEEYDEASWAFRRALQVDARHYVAWVYDELGLPELGLRFIRRPQVHTSARLAVFTKVQTAKLLLRIKEPEDAARELIAALEMASDNAEIHLLLGKAVMLAGRPGLNEVLQRFTVALSLRPQSRVVKDAIARLESLRKTRKITRWDT